jgi:hypothetical protein
MDFKNITLFVYEKFKNIEWYWQVSIICFIIGFLYRYIDPETGFFIMITPLCIFIFMFFSIPGLIFWLCRFLSAKSK